MPRQKACRDEMVSRVLASLGDRVIVPEALAIGCSEHRIDAPTFLGLALVIAPCGLADILIKMLFANPMMDAVNLPLEQRPEAFDRVGMCRSRNVLASGVFDDGMSVLGIQTAIADPFIGDEQCRLPRDVLANESLEGCGIDALDSASNNLAFALDGADDRHLPGAETATASAAALTDMPVLRLAADEGFVNLDDAVERHVERFGLRRIAEPMQHEPCGLLRNPEIAGELRTGDAFLVAGNQPDRDEPLAQGELRIGEDRADFDGEPLPAILAFVGTAVREVVDFGAATVGTECAPRPADRAEMLDTGLLVRECGGQFREGIEGLQHGDLHQRKAFTRLCLMGQARI